MPNIDKYLISLLENQGSDLHLISASPPIIRRFGKMMPLALPILLPGEIEELMKEILSVEDKEKLPNTLNIDFAYEMNLDNGISYRFRGNTFYQKNGLNLVFRSIPNQIPSLDDLGLPSAVSDFCALHQGLVLVTGPSGCGKTSTLAAMIDLINNSRKAHIITIEDPIEFIHNSRNSFISQRQVGAHVDSYFTALRGALRQDPDIILVGEMRDLESTEMAITAAETGHLVLSTMHTRTAINTVNRLIDAFPPEQQNQIRTSIADSLKGVISQQLIPRADGRGRVLAAEVMIVTSSISNLIKDNRVSQIYSTMQMGKNQGMTLMDNYLNELQSDGTITREEALARSMDIKSYEVS
jgi:twitching motility protein PilT